MVWSFAKGYLLGICVVVLNLNPLLAYFFIPILRPWASIGIFWCILANPTPAFHPDQMQDGIERYQLIQTWKSPWIATRGDNAQKYHPSSWSFCFDSLNILGERACFEKKEIEIYPSYLNHLHENIMTRIQSQPSHLSALSKALLLGHSLPKEMKNIFKRSGLYHIVIISGFHMSLFASLLWLTLRNPLRALYSIKIIGSKSYCQLEVLIFAIIVTTIIHYALLVGLGPAAQRACLITVIGGFHKLFYPVRFSSRCLIAATIQCLWFPLTFFSIGNIMSWSAYLLVCRKIKLMPLLLFALCYIFFDQNELVQILVNICFVPLFIICIPLVILSLFNNSLSVFTDLGIQSLMKSLEYLLDTFHLFTIPLILKPFIILLVISWFYWDMFCKKPPPNDDVT